LTGGDTITATAKYQNVMSYRPEFKMWILTNELPAVSDMGQAMWRRIRPIPFNRVIPTEVRRPRAAIDEELDGEWSGILAWAIAGLVAWNGLPEEERWGAPAAVTVAQDEYKSSMDVVRQFLDEECEYGPDVTTGKKSLYRGYQLWCKNSGLKFVLTSNAFVRRLRKMAGVTVSEERVGADYIVSGVKYRLDKLERAMPSGEDMEE
jgi:putative DNA primase/helicase